jgi:hypothetical protein
MPPASILLSSTRTIRILWFIEVLLPKAGLINNLTRQALFFELSIFCVEQV